MLRKFDLSTFNKLLFLIFLFVLRYTDFTISLIFCLIIFFLIAFQIKKIIPKLFFSILLLSLLVVVGMITGLFNKQMIYYNYLKDCMYFVRPILVLLIGYGLIQNIKEPKFFVKVIVYIGLIFSICHILGAIYFIFKIGFSVNMLRSKLGLGNEIGAISLALLFIKNERSNLYLKLKYRKIAILILFISFVLYFSRTDFVIFAILFISNYGVLKISPKSLVYFLFFCFLTFSGWHIINNLELTPDSKGVKFFLYKIKNSPNEIFNKNINYRNDRSLWENWRSYEALCAVSQVKSTTYGNGFGSLIDIKRKIYLNGVPQRYIPIIHNGYAYVYFKTGAIGLIILLLFIFYNMSTSHSVKDKSVDNFLVGLSTSFLFSTLVVTGFYVGAIMWIYFYGCLLGLQLKNNGIL